MKYLLLPLLLLVSMTPFSVVAQGQQNSINMPDISSYNSTAGVEDQSSNNNNGDNVSITSGEEGSNQSQPFKSAFDTFVTSEPEGYGMYEEKESNVFQPGEPIILYIEPVGYEYQNLADEKGNKVYLMDFTADFTISDVNGTELTSQQGLSAGHLLSHHQNKELYLPFTITQNSPFPQGTYSIKYTIHDTTSGNSFDIVKNVTIS